MEQAKDSLEMSNKEGNSSSEIFVTTVKLAMNQHCTSQLKETRMFKSITKSSLELLTNIYTLLSSSKNEYSRVTPEIEYQFKQILDDMTNLVESKINRIEENIKYLEELEQIVVAEKSKLETIEKEWKKLSNEQIQFLVKDFVGDDPDTIKNKVGKNLFLDDSIKIYGDLDKLEEGMQVTIKNIIRSNIRSNPDVNRIKGLVEALSR